MAVLWWLLATLATSSIGLVGLVQPVTWGAVEVTNEKKTWLVITSASWDMEHPLAHNYDVTSIEIYPLIALPIEMALQIGAVKPKPNNELSQ